MSTQHRDQVLLQTKLDRVKRRSQGDPKAEFNNLGHLIDLDLLRLCYHGLDGSKAVGIDGMTKESYGKELERNLANLLRAIRTGAYHPRASRTVEIPKSDGSKRPLAISCFEDKIVQEALRRVLESIYEPLFLDCSHGFRPKRGCDTALVALDRHLIDPNCGAVLEIDLRKYFDTIPHEPLMRMLELKIKDPRFLRLVKRLLKAPNIDKQDKLRRSEIGSPQGSIVSPLLANIYLHYVLDLWFRWIMKRSYGGRGRMVRYADDVVFVMESFGAARLFERELEGRLEKFGISLNRAKSRAIASGKLAAHCHVMKGKKLPTFTFLGFKHVWCRSISRKTGKGFWRVKRFTCPIRYRKKLKEIADYVRKHRHQRGLVAKIVRVVAGYLNYFAINDNIKRVHLFIHEVRAILFKFLKRRSQRGLSPERFNRMMDHHKFPQPMIRRHLFFNLSRPAVTAGKCR